MRSTWPEKLEATLTASWPVRASTTSRISAGAGDVGDRLHLVHQRLVDVEPAGGVEQEHVKALELRRLERAAGDLDRLLAGDDRQGRDLGLLAEHRELLLGGRAGDVERRHHHLLAALSRGGRVAILAVVVVLPEP